MLPMYYYFLSLVATVSAVLFSHPFRLHHVPEQHQKLFVRIDLADHFTRELLIQRESDFRDLVGVQPRSLPRFSGQAESGNIHGYRPDSDAH